MTPSIRRPRRYRLVKATAVGSGLIVVLVLALILVLPFGLRVAVIEALGRFGLDQSQVESVDFSFLDGRLTVDGVNVAHGKAQASGFETLTLEAFWRPLLDKRAHFRRAEVIGARLSLKRGEDGTLALSGLPLVINRAEGGGLGWDVGADEILLTDATLTVEGLALPLEVKITSLEVIGLRSWTPDDPASIKLTARINGARLDAAGSLRPFAANPGAGKLALNIEGISLQSLMPLINQPGLTQLSGEVSLSLKGALQTGADGPTLELADSQIKISNFAAATDDHRLTAGLLEAGVTAVRASSTRATWATNLTGDEVRLQTPDFTANAVRLEAASITGTTSAGSLSATLGDANLTDLMMTLGADADQLQIAAANLPTLSLGLDADGQLSIAGRADLTTIALSMGSPEALARANAVSVDAEYQEPTGLSLDGQASGLAALPLPNSGWLVRAKKATVSGLKSRDFSALEIKRVGLEGADFDLHIGKDGLIGLPQGNDDSDPAMALFIDRLDVDGGSKLSFQDDTVTPPVAVNLPEVTLRLSQVDSRPGSPQSLFRLRAKVGEFGSAWATGSIDLFTLPDDMDVVAKADGLNLTAVGSYLAESLGVAPNSGNLSLDSRIQISGGKLESTNEVRVTGLTFPPADKTDQVNGVPLRKGASLLRDGNGTINLMLPVKGDLENPQFDLSDAVGQAVGSVFRDAVFTALKVLFPPAAIGSFIFDALAGDMKVPPVVFAAGDASLSPEAIAYMTHLSDKMAENKGLVLTLCGYARPDETSADDLAPLDLAMARTRAVKAELVERHNIAQSRLAECQPALDPDPQAVPRVEIGL